MEPEPRAPRHARRLHLAARLVAATFALSTLLGALVVPAAAADRVYRNPLKPVIPGTTTTVDSCADPTVIKEAGHAVWWMYCTTDPLNDTDKNTSGDFNFHLIPTMWSRDLVHWRYSRDAFTTRPPYATSDAGLWAPEIIYHPENKTYYLYYTVTDTTLPGGGSAIGVATSAHPNGPWIHRATPVVEPHEADCCEGSRRWVFDPEVVRTGGQDYIYYGSYFGGISVRFLSENGFTSTPIPDGDPNTGTQNVAIANKYEGAEVEWHGGYYYLFASATDCCRGPLTGYAVFVGRSPDSRGPFLDRDGISMNDNEGPPEQDKTNARAGGTPVIYQTGNRWVGTGHNTIFKDYAGQWWTIYHGVDVNNPYFAGAPGFTKRPALLDAIDWVNGWPQLNGGRGPSATTQPAPAGQPGQANLHRYIPAATQRFGDIIASKSDEFNGSALSSKWTWVRPPATGTSVSGGWFRFNTQNADLHTDSNNASVLTERAPTGDYMVQAKVKLNLPAEGCCFNFVQAGIVIYGNDDNFLKLTHVSIFNTRQTEWAKEVGPPVPSGYPRYGNTVVGPPRAWTFLRIVKKTVTTGAPTGLYGGSERYTAYTSLDGVTWRKGGSWTHHLGSTARIGLVSMGGSGFTASFDWVRVYRLG